MPLYGLAQGSLDALEGEQRRSLQGAQMLAMQQQAQQRQMALQEMARQVAARQNAGRSLYAWAGDPGGGAPMPGMAPPPMPQVPPPPPNVAPAPSPGTLSPGGGNPQMGPPATPPPAATTPAAPAGPQGMAPPPMPLPPFRAMPTAPAAGPGAPQAAPGMVPPPPAPPAEAPVQPPPHTDIRKLVQRMKAAGVPPDQVLEQIDQLVPIIKMQQQDELSFWRAQTAGQAAAIKAYQAEINAYKAQRDLDIKEKAEGRRTVQGDRRLDQKDDEIAIKRQKEQRLRAAASGAAGAGNLKSTEFIYPKGEDGQPDTNKAPIGVRGLTKTGKIIMLDADGNRTNSLEGGTQKEKTANKGGAQAAVRTSLVKGSAVNALRLLDEAENMGNTSAFFGYHADNPLTKSASAATKSASMSQQDRQTDAHWAGLIEEAGPVLSGGLRNSDAFRRFLLDQAPAMGDDAATRKKKIKILRDNISGTSSAFFNKFASDPKMWAEGVTKEDIERAKAARAGGGGTSPPQGVPAGSKKIGKTPQGKDVWEAADGTRYTPD